MMTQRRIRKDLKQWKEDPLDCAQVTTNPNDYKKWDVMYFGPEETPYENGVFAIEVKFPNDFPFKPPDLKFMTPIYHVNVSRKGKVCLAQILDEWNPQYTMLEVIEWLDKLILDPIQDSAIVNDEMVLEFLENRETYDKTAAEWTKKYAIPDSDKAEAKKDDEKQDDQGDEKQNDNNTNIGAIGDDGGDVPQPPHNNDDDDGDDDDDDDGDDDGDVPQPPHSNDGDDGGDVPQPPHNNNNDGDDDDNKGNEKIEKKENSENGKKIIQDNENPENNGDGNNGNNGNNGDNGGGGANNVAVNTVNDGKKPPK